MNPRNRVAQYRTVNGVRERLCEPCARWLPYDVAHFYGRADGTLRTPCRDCQRAICRHSMRRKYAEETRQREYARAAADGRIPA